MGVAALPGETHIKQPRQESVAIKILVVDDEEDILDILARVLGSVGYHVDLASNGQKALERVALQDYDLIITNIRMPIMGGEEFYRRLTNSFPRMSHKVVFCTGDIANQETQRFLGSTGAPVIFKPFQLRTVLEVVAWQLTRERQHLPAHVPVPAPSSNLKASTGTVLP
jgi:CheY-like chemotaxis protein